MTVRLTSIPDVKYVIHLQCLRNRTSESGRCARVTKSIQRRRVDNWPPKIRASRRWCFTCICPGDGCEGPEILDLRSTLEEAGHAADRRRWSPACHAPGERPALEGCGPRGAATSFGAGAPSKSG